MKPDGMLGHPLSYEFDCSLLAESAIAINELLCYSRVALFRQPDGCRQSTLTSRIYRSEALIACRGTFSPS